MRKKVAIITLYDETNYGNRLQNYAVSRYLTQMGLTCETLVFAEPQAVAQKVKNRIKRTLRHTVFRHNEMARRVSFEKFSNTYIPKRKLRPGYPLEQLAPRYDAFVVGSDQVWNPCFGGYEPQFDRMLLTFAPREKKVCFSPSFGVSELPDMWKPRFREALAAFDRISVREEDGVRIVRELTGKEAVCLIDPTMLFDGEEWLKIARKPPERDYVFSYFLGACHTDLIPKGKTVVDVLDRASGRYYRCNPADFVGLIANADAVYTDSFHACVFSILFDKPFCVLERQDGYTAMSSRIQTLLCMFGVRYDTAGRGLIHIDRALRDRVLSEKREDVRRFLQAQLAAEDV